MPSISSRTTESPSLPDVSLRVRKTMEILDFHKGEHVVAFDARAQVSFLDWVVVTTATGESHARALARYVTDAMTAMGERPRMTARRKESAQWLALDYGDLVIHIFRADMRIKYGFDARFQGCPKIAV